MSQVVPFPPAGGEKIRSFGLLRCLSGSGHSVTAITPSLTDLTGAARFLPGVTFLPYNFEPPSGLTGQFAGYFRKDAKLAALVREQLAKEKYDLAFIDYFFLGQYISLFKHHGIPVIYGTHNAQSKLRLQQPAIGFKDNMVRTFSYIAQAGHERLYFKQAGHLVCVSNVDYKFYRKFIPDGKISVIPNFVDETLYHPVTKKEPYVIITGNFTSFQNYYGLEWLMREVWNEELEGLTTLYLAGKGAEKAMELAAGGKHYGKVVIMENPADFSSLIASASAALVPLWHGSGTRLKCIEAMALKTQLISTTIGAEGIEHEGSILIADTASGFRESIKQCLSGKADHTGRAFEIFRQKYSLEAGRKTLDGIILSLVKK